MAYELDQPFIDMGKRVASMHLHDHEQRSIDDIRRIYERGLYRGRQMLMEHIEYLQHLIRKCRDAMSIEQSEGYNNVELRESANDLITLHKKLTELVSKMRTG